MKVLLIEDSPSVRAYIEGVLRSAPDIELLPSAPDGISGVERAVAAKPDVILMDLELPLLDGIQAIGEIMALMPRPIVVLSGRLCSRGYDRTFEAFNAGAVDVLAKPEGLGTAAITSFGERLLRTVRVMREARVVRRHARPLALGPTQQSGSPSDLIASPGSYDLVVIGSSTGGPEVLIRILRQIPRPFRLPIVIGQHIMSGFEHGLATWLSTTGHRAVVAQAGDWIQPGVVYVLPTDNHLAIRPTRFELLPSQRGPPTPSVDLLFQTTAEAFGARSVALLLSGMGDDGSRGMLSLRKSGALTLTQALDTCTIDAMPKAAQALSASCGDLSPSLLAEVLGRLMPAR